VGKLYKKFPMGHQYLLEVGKTIPVTFPETEDQAHSYNRSSYQLEQYIK
jgi:hypothetical protein